VGEDAMSGPGSCPESGVNREHGRRFRFTTCKSAKKEVTPVPVRVSATDRIRTKIGALFAEDRELPEILEEVARLGAQLLMQAALEAEVTEFLAANATNAPPVPTLTTAHATGIGR
jgi:hypothetical protein